MTAPIYTPPRTAFGTLALIAIVVTFIITVFVIVAVIR
jgi:hypothetical protein